MTSTSDAVKIVRHLIGKDTRLRQMVERETVNAHVAKLIFEARTQAGLTQQQLAALVGTKQPVIARLEDADYAGHSLMMLQRIAAALNRRLEIRLKAARRRDRAA